MRCAGGCSRHETNSQARGPNAPPAARSCTISAAPRALPRQAQARPSRRFPAKRASYADRQNSSIRPRSRPTASHRRHALHRRTAAQRRGRRSAGGTPSAAAVEPQVPVMRRMFEALLDPGSIQWMLMIGGGLCVLGIIVWLVSKGIFENKRVLAVALGVGTLAILAAGWFAALRTRFHVAGPGAHLPRLRRRPAQPVVLPRAKPAHRRRPPVGRRRRVLPALRGDRLRAPRSAVHVRLRSGRHAHRAPAAGRPRQDHRRHVAQPVPHGPGAHLDPRRAGVLARAETPTSRANATACRCSGRATCRSARRW